MKKAISYALVAATPLLSLVLIAASPSGGLAVKVEWLLAQFGEGTALKEDAGRVPPLGTIIPSVLPWELMPDGFKKTWFPADGGSLEGTALGDKLLAAKSNLKTYPNLFTPDGKPKAPDLRGVFLRGLNVFDVNATVVDGEHRGDPETDDYRSIGKNKRTVGDWQADQMIHHEHKFQFNGPTQQPVYDGRAPLNTEFEKLHKEDTEGGGFGPETRPRNIAIYYYVRVN
jgi:hypothetical protein